MDSHTMVKSASESAGTMRATGTMSDGAQTMIEHGSTMLESDLGTMVINSDDDDDDDEVDLGSMRSEYLYHLFSHIFTLTLFCCFEKCLICFFFPFKQEILHLSKFSVHLSWTTSTKKTQIKHKRVTITTSRTRV